jgi:RNA polymerase sigma-70 factor (ECF subfamily)
LRPAAARDDVDLVQRAQQGDREAFEALVTRYADRLYTVVLRFCGDSDEAQEVTQEAFLRAWRSLDRFEGRSQFFTWLYRIGINEAKRRAERQRPHAATGYLDESGQDIPDRREAPGRVAEARDLQRALERAIAALPPDYRLPLILRDIEGLSTEEAADVMDLKQAAFKSRLHRARMQVREAVEPLMPEGDDRR